MRVLLRVLAPLLSLAVAAIGALVVVEVVAAWVGRVSGAGLLVPWRDWRTTVQNTLWTAQPVLWIAVGVIVVGAVLLLVGLLARRHDRVVFLLVVEFRDFVDPGDKLIRHPGHGRNDDGNLVAFLDHALHALGDVSDALDIRDRRTAEFENQTCHNRDRTPVKVELNQRLGAIQ